MKSFNKQQNCQRDANYNFHFNLSLQLKINIQSPNVGTAIQDFSWCNTQYTQIPYQFLEFRKDDRIVMLQDSKTHIKDRWMFGYIEGNKDQQGWFPSNFVSFEERNVQFGAPIYQMCRIENRVIPKIIQNLSEHLRQHAKTDGIFRKSAQQAVVDQFIQQNTNDISMVAAPLDAAQVYKNFFVLHPYRLIPDHIVQKMLKLKEDETTPEKLADYLRELDYVEDFINFRYMLETLNYISQFHEFSQMGSFQIARLICGGVLENCSASESSKETLFQKLIDLQPQMEQYFQKVFPRPDPGQSLNAVPWVQQYYSFEPFKTTCKRDFCAESAKALVVRKGDEVTVLRRSNKWLFCEFNHLKGWIDESVIE